LSEFFTVVLEQTGRLQMRKTKAATFGYFRDYFSERRTCTVVGFTLPSAAVSESFITVP